MDADLSTFLFTGIVAIVVGTTALILIVRGNLLPAGASDGGGRWFLGAALGAGIIAFTIKMIVVLTISTFPEKTITPLIAHDGHFQEREKMPPESPDYWSLMRPGAKGSPVWQALPDRAPDPEDNPTTPEKVALGEKLFFETNLSLDRKVACASCHDLMAKGGADGLRTAVGITAVPGKRNVPTVWNAAFQRVFFWDGRAKSLEEQAGGPPLNPDEMGMPNAAAIEERVKADPAYAPMFKAAFGIDAAITMDRITAAIAAYERTLITPDTPYDRFVRGEISALTPSQKRGMWLFETVGCITCHTGPNFSNASVFGQSGPYRLFPANDSPYRTRYALSDDKGKAAPASPAGIWRIPSLRNVALTAPYFHNGSVSNLREAVRVMAVSQLNAVISDESSPSDQLAWNMERKSFDTYRRRILTSRDVDDIAAFLETLTSDRLRAKVSAK
jgi:cytochrome c peroxidase